MGLDTLATIIFLIGICCTIANKKLQDKMQDKKMKDEIERQFDLRFGKKTK